MQPIPLSLVRAGREVTEPEMSPDRMWAGFVQRWRGGASINAVPIVGDGLERQLTFGPDPAAGRGLGGGCFTWLTQPGPRTSFVYAAVDGELWWQDDLRLERITSHERTVRGPAVACQALRIDDDRDHRHVVYAVDEAEVWILDLRSGDSRRLDDGRHAFCFDPSISPDERIVSWQGWSPPDMPWDGSVRVDCDLRTGTISEWVLTDAALPAATIHAARRAGPCPRCVGLVQRPRRRSPGRVRADRAGGAHVGDGEPDLRLRRHR